MQICNLHLLTMDFQSHTTYTRNVLLYKEITGITDVANAVKVYIKSVFGATSPQYKQVSSLKFTNYNQ